MGQFTPDNSFKFGPYPMDRNTFTGTGAEEWNLYGTTIKSSYYDPDMLEESVNESNNNDKVNDLEQQKNQTTDQAEKDALTDKQNTLNEENNNTEQNGDENSNNIPNTERNEQLANSNGTNGIANDSSTNSLSGNTTNDNEVLYSPFDLRLKRAIGDVNRYTEKMPYSYASRQSAINEFSMTPEQFNKLYNGPNKDKYLEALKNNRKNLENDPLFQGYSAVMNPYAIIRLYNVKKSSDLLNLREQRRFYEVDGNSSNYLNYSLNPTTSSLIAWGNNDPYGRTPYSFADFVFCKYWNIIPNNRLITLRRYAAPILDNLSYLGMGESESSEKVMFPPMATAVTYFGGESGNKLSDILKFSTGYNWRELSGDMWTVTGEQVDVAATATKILGAGAGIVATTLGVMGNDNDSIDYNLDAIMLKGQEWPDPYEDGPYENRILGPVNRIDKVKARAPGINFDMNGLKIVFEYVGRPIGGINTKAAMLDILANFLVIGTGNAVFFGGAHRFKIKPAIFPFKNDILKKLYDGHGYAAVLNQLKLYAEKLTVNSLEKDITDIKNTITNLGKEVSNVTDSNPVAEPTSDRLQSLSSAYLMGLIGIPYLKGMKAILTGEPVGDWHLTIGNPLNPIALIGNLICKNIEIECNDELGLDDFPTEWKITVNLEHGMARDKGAIESMFNRGAGRIYELPDNFELSNSNNETTVDNYTGNNNKGNNIGGIDLHDENIATSFNTDTPNQYGEIDNVNGTELSTAGDANTVFNKSYYVPVRTNDLINFNNATINTRSFHAKSSWIGKTLK